MSRARRWFAAIVAAAFTGWLAKQVWGFWTLAALRRHDEYLEVFAWFLAAIVVAGGLGAIASLFRSETAQEGSRP